MVQNNDVETRKDLLRRWQTTLLAWGIPIGLLLIGGKFQQETVLWPIALAWMAVGCYVNAKRSGRLHCYATAPFFLLMALLSLIHGLNIWPFGEAGWDWIGAATIVGGFGLYFLSELIWGRYVRR